MTNFAQLAPDIKISVNQIFGIDTDMKVDGFSKKNEYVPEIDSTYKFDRDTTLAIISGFAFNKSWDYFDGMNQSEIEDFLKSDMTWHRPTQQFGSPENFFNILWNNVLNDKFNFFKNEKNSHKLNGKNLTTKDMDAFKIMGLELNASWPIIQKKFKMLVKKFHPDKNSGNKEFEDKLKRITLAYSHLKMIMIKK